MSVAAKFALGTISALVVGLAIATYTYHLNTPESAVIEVKYQYLKVPNPTFFLNSSDYAAIGDLYKKLRFSFPVTDLLGRVSRDSELSIVTVSIKNRSDLRSKSVEVSLGGSVFWHRDGGRSTLADRYQMDSLDPGETVGLIAFADVYRLLDPQLRALHDGRKIETFALTIPDSELYGLAQVAVHAPGLIGFLTSMGAVLLLTALVGIPIAIILRYNVALKAKLIAAPDAKRLQVFLDYVRQHYPDKLA